LLILSRLDAYEIGRAYVLQHSKRIDPKVLDTSGSDANLVVGSTAYMASAVSNQIAENAANLFLNSCFGEDLDRYVYDRYLMTRLGASAALGTVLFTRRTAVGVGAIPSGTKLTTLTGLEYLTLASANFGASDLTARVDVRAAQAGKASQVGQNAIRSFETPTQIFDQTIVLTNPETTAGGEDVEDDDTFKQRVRDFWRSARRGTLGAIEFGARSVPGVVSAMAVDELVSLSGGPVRAVRLLISDSSGVASDALAAKVSSALVDFRAGGIFVRVDLSLPQIVDVGFRPTVAAGVDSVTLVQAVQAALVTYVNSLGVGQTLHLGDLRAVLSRFMSSGLVANQRTIVAPVADVFPGPQRTLRTTLANVQIVL